MSRPHSRSPLYSRNSTMPGRREDGFSGEQYHSSVRSDPWRNPENVNKLEGNSHWDNGPSQGEEEVDHWAKFIEAIGHAGKRRPAPMSRHLTQDDVQRFEEKPSHSQRKLPRERLSSPEAFRYGSEKHPRIPSPGRRRNEHEGSHLNRHYSSRTHWDSRGSSPRHSQEKRHGRMEHIHHNDLHEERYHERSSFSERSLKSNYREDQPHPKRFRGSEPHEEYSVTHRGFSPHNSPVIVEHDHGIPHPDARNRDPPRRHNPLRNQERSRNRDLQRINDMPGIRGPPRSNDLPLSREPTRGHDLSRSRDPPRGHDVPKGSGPLRGNDLPGSRGPPRGNDLPGSRGPPRDNDLSQSRDPPRGNDSSRSRDPPRGNDLPGSRGPPRASDLPGSRGPPRGNDSSRSRDPTRGNDSSRSRDPPRGNDSSRTRDPPRGNDPSRTRDPPKGNDLPGSRGPPRGDDLPHSRDPPRGHDMPSGRGPPRMSEPPRSMESLKHRRDPDHHTGLPHDGRGQETRSHHPSVERRSPMRGRLHHQEQTRMERQRHGQRAMDLTSDVDLRNDLSNRPRFSGHAWNEEPQAGGKHGGVSEKGKYHHMNFNTDAGPADRMDFTEHETLRIKVDMSRPVGLSSHLGYSSERQLSLDLVNVGRQRLDFLPMLEHSGTYRESAMHSGTFAQEIITLVHHVKENYFQGQGITLNERFSSEQHYTLADEEGFSEEEQELEEIKPVVNRPLEGSSSQTQIFCKIGSWQPQRRHVPAPGDLRHDLERKRQQRLEGVKITIAGGSFSQMAPQRLENEPEYIEEDDGHEAGDDFDWSEQMPQETEPWDGPLQKVAPPFDARQNFNHFEKRYGPRMRRNPDDSW